MEDVVLPEIRRLYFSNLAIDAFLQEFMEIYRGTASHLSALIDVWNRIDTQIPLTSEEYEELVERFCALLEDEPDPPSKADWKELDTWLMKSIRPKFGADDLYRMLRLKMLHLQDRL